ncbi:deoxyribodipyrimidine photo-lyase [Aestuariirhabdus sp. Z084]|uniref:deoxyribodipyrimidine photo-lyase n=1 Tax=Aestuariirhabdus haliotis TaxID=2918751 RepID=UPI00201B42C9|nr:deoxyribodipyrimidine photo-lyase [Aestuariirhabdus haliotis]MCL6414101.1 deoxyribodipyrimidine photo-lyase [Aestuariirhabdus haliotis]MCL6418033.1 deoxyribodipyrimidine photo-lyase [Aestuariirhabdus haliotis]
MNLVWFRNDLRLDDHPALYHACQHGGAVTAVYCVTPEQWQAHDESPAKLGFRQAALNDLARRLAEKGIALELLKAGSYQQLPEQLGAFCQQRNITNLWFNRDIPWDEQQRDNAVVAYLQSCQIVCHEQAADLIYPSPLNNKQGLPFKVFTPWYRAWLQCVQQLHRFTVPEPTAAAAPRPEPDALQLPGSSDYRADLWPAHEAEALARLHHFLVNGRRAYNSQRDIPSMPGTSTLSPYLASGLLSPRRCLQMIQQSAAAEGWEWQEDAWLRELGWREFYRYLMAAFPRLSRNQPFKAQTRHLQWEVNPHHLQAWQQGHTGFPLVDAGMRQLARTGWMHNRLRMLTASFLCKLLLIDWREGEAFFMQHLLDGDFPSNNGGWQWSASTGCDASPWFRIFNPTRQSERFDPEGHFIRKLVPELASLDSRQIHNPPQKVREALGYPAPVIDYRGARERVLQRFRELNETESNVS